MSNPRTWEDELLSRGEAVRPGPGYKCPACQTPTHAFTIVETPDGWACTTCLAPSPAEQGGLTWNDVRGVRSVFLQASDWTQLPDVPQSTSEAWAPLRQRARDVGSEATPDAAMEVLRSLQQQAAAL